MKKILLMLIGLVAIIITTSCEFSVSTFSVNKINDYFYEAGTYTTLDYNFVNNYFADEYDNWGGGCSAVSTVIDGKRYVGRNMDLNISNKCAYFVRTNVKGKYETIGFAYTFRKISPDYEDLKNNGLSETFKKILPFMCDDVMNNEGLHIEINMRHGEQDENGNDIFSVEHTNASATERVYVFALSQYIALNCKTIEEVKTYLAESIDVYSQKNYWNYCFIVTDGLGNSELLEFGNGKYYWIKPNENGVIAQTNFYINEECNQMEDIKTGLGRYETIMNNIESVNSKLDLYNLMKKVSYSSYYTGYDNCKNNHFDPRSEIIGEAEGLTYNFVMDPSTEPLIKNYLDGASLEFNNLTRLQQQDLNYYWESTFTEVVDTQNKVIEVRLFENDNYLYKINFNGIKKITNIEICK